MQGNHGDSWFLVVGSQIGNLPPDPSFDHNLCFKCLNESCKPILNIYVPRAFQQYKDFFNPMSLDPCNCPLKIWKSIGTPTPKMGAHLGVWDSFPHTFLHSRNTLESMKCDSWASLLAHTFTSPCFGRKPKARVTIILIYQHVYLEQYKTCYQHMLL